MNSNGVRKPEQIKLILECRRSGRSDYQWCQKQGINPGTFYNWVSKLRKAGYTIPDPAGKVLGVPLMQEVVKLGLVESEISTPAMMEQSTKGGGFKVNWGGDRILQYHPENLSHHDGAYFKISSGETGTIRIDLDGNIIE